MPMVLPITLTQYKFHDLAEKKLVLVKTGNYNRLIQIHVRVVCDMIMRGKLQNYFVLYQENLTNCTVYIQSYRLDLH